MTPAPSSCSWEVGAEAGDKEVSRPTFGVRVFPFGILRTTAHRSGRFLHYQFGDLLSIPFPGFAIIDPARTGRVKEGVTAGARHAPLHG